MNWRVREALRILRAGGTIAYPTETVYGLGCDPFSGSAVLHLLALKQRDIGQGVILIAGNIAQLEPLLDHPAAALRKRIARPCSPPVTWVVPCRPETPQWLSGGRDTLAVRITSHPLARALCDGLDGPLVSTSANLHGGHPATTALAVRRAFDNRLDAIVHGACTTGRPSTLRDAVTGHILRK